MHTLAETHISHTKLDESFNTLGLIVFIANPTELRYRRKNRVFTPLGVKVVVSFLFPKRSEDDK